MHTKFDPGLANPGRFRAMFGRAWPIPGKFVWPMSGYSKLNLAGVGPILLDSTRLLNFGPKLVDLGWKLVEVGPKSAMGHKFGHAPSSIGVGCFFGQMRPEVGNI